MWTFRLAGFTFATALIVLGSGCGKKMKTYPVAGRVSFPDGSPLTGGTVEFESTAPGTEGTNAQGIIQADGRFTMATMFDKKELLGVVEGPHRVVVIPPAYSESTVGTEGGPPASPINARFKSYEKSGLTFEVKANQPNECLITVDK